MVHYTSADITEYVLFTVLFYLAYGATGCYNSYKAERQVDPPADWIHFAGGVFQFSSLEKSIDNGGDSEGLVAVSDFFMQRTEVTVAQYTACIDAQICPSPDSSGNSDSNWYGSKPKTGREEHPANEVTWEMSQVFCRWVGGRLPLESEWEYAARNGGQEVKYPWCEKGRSCPEPNCDYVVMDDETHFDGCGPEVNQGTERVCSRPKGNSLYGICDLIGNVREWVQEGTDVRDKLDDLDVVITRGGDLYSDGRDLSVTHRRVSLRGRRYSDTGFRCVREVTTN